MPCSIRVFIMIEAILWLRLLRYDIEVVDFAVRAHRSLWVDAWRRLISSNTARLGMFVVAVFVLSATFAHFFWEYNPKTDLDYTLKLKPPNLVAN